MSEKHLIEAIGARYKALPRRKRLSEVRKFAGRSKDDAKFFQEYFPDLYHEAFRVPSSSAGGARQQPGRISEPQSVGRRKTQNFAPFHYYFSSAISKLPL